MTLIWKHSPSQVMNSSTKKHRPYTTCNIGSVCPRGCICGLFMRAWLHFSSTFAQTHSCFHQWRIVTLHSQMLLTTANQHDAIDNNRHPPTFIVNFWCTAYCCTLIAMTTVEYETISCIQKCEVNLWKSIFSSHFSINLLCIMRR